MRPGIKYKFTPLFSKFSSLLNSPSIFLLKKYVWRQKWKKSSIYVLWTYFQCFHVGWHTTVQREVQLRVHSLKSNRVVKYWLPASSVVYRTLRFLHIVFSNQMKLLENIKKEFRLTRILLGQIFDQVNKDLPTNR